jgi:predicted metal-binding membrane protein
MEWPDSVDRVTEATSTSTAHRDRIFVGSALAVVVIAAWLYLVQLGPMPEMTTPQSVAAPQASVGTGPSGIESIADMAMASSRATGWRWIDVGMLTVMWVVMMVAMMTPTATPMILIFSMVHRQRAAESRPAVPTAVFLLGYLAVWTVLSVLAALVQEWLHVAALLSPMMATTSPILTGALLLLAGLFQWTPLKRACLTECRSPLAFVMTRWRDGRRGAFVMGLHHGAYCLVCCWAVMALLFVAGVMNSCGLQSSALPSSSRRSLRMATS